MPNILESLLEIKIEKMKLDPPDLEKYNEQLEKEINDKFLSPSKFSL